MLFLGRIKTADDHLEANVFFFFFFFTYGSNGRVVTMGTGDSCWRGQKSGEKFAKKNPRSFVICRQRLRRVAFLKPPAPSC